MKGYCNPPHRVARNGACQPDTAVSFAAKDRKPTKWRSVGTPIAQLVPRMINVDKRSSTESTNDAVSEMELEYHTATPLARTRSKLTIVLTMGQLGRTVSAQLTVQGKLGNPFLLALAFGKDQRRALANLVDGRATNRMGTDLPCLVNRHVGSVDVDRVVAPGMVCRRGAERASDNGRQLAAQEAVDFLVVFLDTPHALVIWAELDVS